MASKYTKRHYQQFANVIVDARMHAQGFHGADPEVLTGIALVEQRMIRVFELDNPSFSAETFVKWTQPQD